MSYILEVELKSETVFGSGNAVSGVVDQEILHDAYGFPYMKGKTIKGKLKEEFAHVLWCLSKGEKGIEDPAVEELFGAPSSNNDAVLKFSDLCINKKIRQLFKEKIEEKSLNARDVLNASTDIRNFTSIDYSKGVTKKGFLRRIRVMRSGLYFYGTIDSDRDLSEREEQLLAMAAASLKHLGTMETRGKGHVKVCLLKESDDLTKESIEKLTKGDLHEISVF